MSAVSPNPNNAARAIAALLHGASANQLAARLLQMAGSLAKAHIYARYLLELLKRRDVQKALRYTGYTVLTGLAIALLANPVGLFGFSAGGVVAGEHRVENQESDG